MPSLPPKVGAHLLEATQSRDLDEAFTKVFTEYLTLKIQSLQQVIEGLEAKWGMDFSNFKRRTREGNLPVDSYDFDVEQDFWRWEEAETLKVHYEHVQNEWM